VIAVIDTAGAATASAPDDEDDANADQPAVDEEPAAPAAKDRPKAKDEPGEDDESAEEDEPTKAEPKAAQAKLKAKEKDAPLPRPDSATGGDGKKAPAFAQASPGKVLAAPATRRRARETGVDLAAIRGTGPSGRVTN